MGVEVVEVLAHPVDDVTPVFAALVAGIAQDVELHVEQFLELQAQFRTVELGGVLGVVDEPHGLVARDEVEGRGDIGGQRLFHGRGDAVEHATDDSLHRARVHPRLLHPLRGVVVGVHAHLRQLGAGGRLYLGMGNLESSVEERGAPEDDVLLVHVVLLEHILHTGKPHQVYHAIAVAEVAHQPLLALAVVEGLETQDAAFQLDKRHALEQLVGTVYPTSVYVFVGIVFQQLPEGLNAQFLAQ